MKETIRKKQVLLQVLHMETISQQYFINNAAAETERIIQERNTQSNNEKKNNPDQKK